MSDRLAAEIFIGGDVLPTAVPKLCSAIARERVSLEWGDASFEPKAADDLLEARQESSGVLLLWLCNVDARRGEFDELEAALQKHEIPYTRITEGRGEYAPVRVEFRPGMDAPISVVTDAQGKPVVPVSELVAVERTLVDAVEAGDEGDDTMANELAKQALQMLRAQFPPELPALTEFRIVP